MLDYKRFMLRAAGIAHELKTPLCLLSWILDMKVIYDREADTLTLILSDDKVAESDELRNGVIVDYNSRGQVVSVEILDASLSAGDPTAISYELREETA